jgi:hypothetical protein
MCPEVSVLRFAPNHEGHGFHRLREKLWMKGTGSPAAGKTLDEGHGFTGCGKTLDEGHGFTGCGKTHVLCQGTTLVGP